VRAGVAAIVLGAALPSAAEAAQPACETYSFMKGIDWSCRKASADERRSN
jgi:hypothetical protein